MPQHNDHPPVFGPGDHKAGRIEAARLYQRLAGGGTLTPLPNSGIVLREGEQPYGVFNLEVAQATDGKLGRHLFTAAGLVAGGPPGAIAGAAVDKLRDRRKAKKIKKPKWRGSTLTKVALTSDRTLCWPDGPCVTFLHSMIMQVNVDPPASSVVLEFEDLAPTRLRGPAALWYGVALASLVYPPAEFSTLPTFASFATPPNKR